MHSPEVLNDPSPWFLSMNMAGTDFLPFQEREIFLVLPNLLKELKILGVAFRTDNAVKSR
jgi:hypothetical protein